ncbi:MAG: hypothetical protein JW904_04030 [Spirochaetales bacterium]|nr:hypothetical protein [Spirochaetales bacterium]
MKRILFVLLMICLAATFGWSQAADPSVGLSIIFTDSLAFTGFGVEAYLGNLGLGATLTGFVMGDSTATVFLLEPGAYVRYYFFGPSASMFIGGSASYFTGFGASGSTISGTELGLINLNVPIGFNAMFGDMKEFRFSVEVGPRYTMLSTDMSYGFFFMHFMLQFGMNL